MPSSSGGTRWPSAQRISTVGLGTAALVRQPQRVAAGQVAPPPLEHRPDHRHEIDAGIGQHILFAAALARLAVGPPGQQTEVDQFGQPRRGGSLGDADPAGEVVEPGGAVVGLAHDEHRGLGADTVMVFSIAHWPTADHASRSASGPCSSVTQITSPLGCF